MKLPIGYYAVQNDKTSDSSTFSYKGVLYEVEKDVNLFDTVHEAIAVANETPTVVLKGLDYEKFDTPVIIFSAGEHSISEFYFKKSVTLLGQGAGINPNLPVEKIEERPLLNPERTESETLIYGSYWWGDMTIYIPDTEYVVMDGFSCCGVRVKDTREEGCYSKLVFKNIIHKGACGRPLYYFTPVTETSSLKREVYFDNIRVCDFDDYSYGGNFVLLSAKKAVFSGICYDNTEQIFGLSNITRSFVNYSKNCDVTEIIIRDSYFANMRGENGVALSTYGIGERKLNLTIENCNFYNASRKDKSAINAYLENDNCYLQVKDCRFLDDRENVDAAIQVYGNGRNMVVEDNVCEGYSADCTIIDVVSADIPKYITNEPGVTECEDEHRVISFDDLDFEEMDKFYEGTKAYYGDLHVHTNCGGTSDGATPMSEWPEKMDALNLDFVAVVDHKQMRGFFLPEWDESRFIIGTEPASNRYDSDSVKITEFHYNMLFPDKYGLSKVMEKFPEYKWQGDELTGSYIYADFTKERTNELVAFIQSIGGIFVHPHPKTMLASSNILDYYFGEHTFMETLYETYDSHASFKNYDLWVELLNMGKRVYSSCGSDTHRAPTNAVVATFYTKNRSGRTFFDKMKTADFTSGAVGMKMFIDSAPMGSEIEYHEGQKLLLKIDDFYKEEWKENTAYELRIYTDKGLAYKSVFNGELPQRLALEVQKRMYYRAEIFDLTHEYRVAVGNPIWLD